MRRPRLGVIVFHLVMLFITATQIYFAFENPVLLAGVDQSKPMMFLVEEVLPDRYRLGHMVATGEVAQLRVHRREQNLDLLVVYRTQDKGRPYLTEGRVQALQPVFDLGVVKVSWRIFFAAGTLAVWLGLSGIYLRLPALRPGLTAVSDAFGRGFVVLVAAVVAVRWLMARGFWPIY